MSDFERARERRDRAFAVLAVLLVALGLFWPMAQGLVQGQPRFFEWDVPEQYWPDLIYLCGSLHEGELPLWNPYDRAGYPYFADPQAAPYHPMNWALCGVGGPAPHWGFAQLRVVLGFVLAGLFGLAWLRRLALPWSAATAGAAMLMCAPFMRHNWELNLTLAFAFAPLLLYAIERALQERRAIDGALLGFSLGLLAWVGSPPALWQASSFGALYLLVRGVTIVRAEPAARLPLLRTLGLGAALGVGFVGVVFVPGLELAAHSVQSGRALSDIASGGLELAQLDALVWPQPGNHLFVGWLPWLLAPLALGGRALPRFALVTAALAVALALGTNTPLFELAFEWVPGVALFRLPHRYEAWLGPAAALLLAGGVARLEYVAWRARRVGRGALIVAALGAGVALAEGLAPVAAALGLAVLFRLFVAHTERGAFGLALALLVFVETSATLPPERHTRAGAHPGTDLALLETHDVGRGARYVDEFGVSCRSGTRTGRRELRGYQDPLLLRSFERVMAHLRDAPGLLPQFGVTHALQGPHFLHGWDRHFAPPPDELRAALRTTSLAPHVTRVEDALPLAYWTSAMGRVRDRASALEVVRTLAPAPVAVLEEGDDATWTRPGVVEHVPATDWRSERDALSFRVDAPEPGWVVVNEAYYPGWVAEVDGRPAPIERANGLVRALPVPAGTHAVTMRFEPPAARWRWGLLLSWCVLLGLLVRQVVIRRRTRP